MRPIHAVSNDRDTPELWELWRRAEAMMRMLGERFGLNVSLHVRGQETSWGSQGNWLVFEGETGKPPVIPDVMRESCDTLCEDLWKYAKAHF